MDLISDYNDIVFELIAWHFYLEYLLLLFFSIYSLACSTSINPKSLFSQFVQRHSIHGMMEEENVIRPHQEIQALSFEEKKFLLAVERGDVAGTMR